jgi:hypothetical protein
MSALLDLMHAPAILRPVCPDGNVIQGEVDEVLTWQGQRGGISARIELHKHTDGLWMWSTGWDTKSRGHRYRVGPKWGKFAETRDDALFYAVKELEQDLKADDPDAGRICAWARGLT